MVGISAIGQGAFVADRYRVVERLTRFAVADSTLTGVEYEYWLALDEVRGVEVWLQVAASRGIAASAADLAGVLSALRRLNHPAVPAVLDFGEIDVVEVIEATRVEDAHDAADASDAGAAAGQESTETVRQSTETVRESTETVRASRVGYVVLEPVEAESLATVLLRAALTEAEVRAVLVGIADVLKVLHEVGLVHGHLSAYSFLLAERGVLLVDLAAAAALELASGSELTSAADVYALAWLACVALAGVEAVEAEFGVGFDAGSSPESAAAPQLLTLELVQRRRAWAEANLVAAYGLSEQLAAVLVAALGEAAGRPTVAQLAAALRAREEAAEAAEVVEAAEIGEAGQAVAAAELVEAAEIIEAVQVAEATRAVQRQEVESAAAGYAGAVEASEAEAELVGAGVGIAVGETVGVMAGGGSGSPAGRGGRGGGRSVASGLASAPLTPASSPSGRHGSKPQRPKSALYVAIAIVVLIIGAIVWALSSRGSSPSAGPGAGPAPGGSVTATAQASVTPGGTAAAPSATAGQNAGTGSSPTASAAAPNASATAGTGTGTRTGTGTGSTPTPGYSVTPLATAPASPSQALQQIKQTVAQAEAAGQIPQGAQGPINQAVSALQQEIFANSPVQQGVSRLRGALNAPGVPAGFRQQIYQLIPYLSAGSGS